MHRCLVKALDGAIVALVSPPQSRSTNLPIRCSLWDIQWDGYVRLVCLGQCTFDRNRTFPLMAGLEDPPYFSITLCLIFMLDLCRDRVLREPEDLSSASDRLHGSSRVAWG